MPSARYWKNNRCSTTVGTMVAKPDYSLPDSLTERIWLMLDSTVQEEETVRELNWQGGNWLPHEQCSMKTYGGLTNRLKKNLSFHLMRTGNALPEPLVI